MTINLYMDHHARNMFLKEHLFVSEHIITKIINPLQNMDIEQEKFETKLVKTYSEAGYFDEDRYEGSIDAINDQVIDYSIKLFEFQRDMYLSALSYMFHNFEKQLRRFFERELRGYYFIKNGKQHNLDKGIWKKQISEIFTDLIECGWNIEGEDFYRKIDACRLIVNVFKHGKGTSLSELYKKYPEYLKDEFHRKFDNEPFYQDVSIDQQEFTDIAYAIKSFWEKFPQRLNS